MNYTPLPLSLREKNYTPLRFPLKIQKQSSGVLHGILFGVLFLIAATIMGALFFVNSSVYYSKQEENQKYTIAHTNNIAATIAARAELGPYAPTITDSPNRRPTLEPTGVVAGVATSSAIFTPDYTVRFEKCFDSTAINPGTDIKKLAARCPLYLPQGTAQGDLSYMEDGNTISVLKNNLILFSLNKVVPEGQPAPECKTVDDSLFGSGTKSEQCTMVKIAQRQIEVKVNGSTAASSIVTNMTCKDQTEESCTEISTSIVVPVDGGISLLLPYDEKNPDPINLERIK